MNKQEIISVLTELNKITGFRVSLHGANYEEIAAYPPTSMPFCRAVNSIEGEHIKCVECDKNACRVALEREDTYIYKCRFGLTDAVSPLYNFGKLTGFLIVGQVAEDEETRENAVAKLKRITEAAMDLSSDHIPLVDPNAVRSYVKVMTICAQYLTMANAIPVVKPTVAEQAKKFIDENISRKFLIGDICDRLNCSKSTLLTGFKRQYGITVNSYVTEMRLNMAIRLLGEGDMTINDVAGETGFSDQSYFSKVFSAKYGISPSEYRSRKSFN